MVLQWSSNGVLQWRGVEWSYSAFSTTNTLRKLGLGFRVWGLGALGFGFSVFSTSGHLGLRV